MNIVSEFPGEIISSNANDKLLICVSLVDIVTDNGHNVDRIGDHGGYETMDTNTSQQRWLWFRLGMCCSIGVGALVSTYAVQNSLVTIVAGSLIGLLGYVAVISVLIIAKTDTN